MPVAEIISAAAQGAGAIFKAIQAGKQRREGKRILAGLPQDIPDEVKRNQQQAEQMAAEGMPSAQYQRAMRNIQRQQLMALRGSNDRRSALAAIPTIQGVTNDATLDLDAADANQVLANKRQLLDVNNQVANWKDKITQRKWNYAMGLLGAGNNNNASAFDQGIAALGQGANIIAGMGGNSGGGNNGDLPTPAEYNGSGQYNGVGYNIPRWSPRQYGG